MTNLPIRLRLRLCACTVRLRAALGNRGLCSVERLWLTGTLAPLLRKPAWAGFLSPPRGAAPKDERPSFGSLSGTMTSLLYLQHAALPSPAPIDPTGPARGVRAGRAVNTRVLAVAVGRWPLPPLTATPYR